MANIREIARLAGVSVSTVSRVLNNHPYVSEQKRAEIMRIIKERNYVQNSNAVHLSTGKTMVVGVTLPLVNNQYYSSIIEGIAAEAARHQYNLMVCQTNNSSEQEQSILRLLKNKKMDGLIMCSRANGCETIDEYAQYGPIITCEANETAFVSSVHIDHYETFRIGMDYLLGKGHRKIGYCIGRTNSFNSQHRKRAYHDRLRSVGVTPAPEWAFENCLTVQDGKDIAQRIGQMEERARPSALIVSCNHIAAGIVKEAGRLGLCIPDDLAIIGCDDQPVGELLEITTVSSPSSLMGQYAFEMLYDRIIHQRKEKEVRELPPLLVERRTT
ncbi:LacI family DNA-binding transcriptional regulator [Brevibacillus agri]|uniref:LacI family DNA-binding transcriptional regulator n=1 Tax=Brevibacillus agri TaxID=51101 RepID=UPI0018CE1988|nr:LacI family DNA-binding transcriptional regulator [Brevibacillus agri]MBG9566853.1 LacI family transcriptional regulator [Brevibacillus agri]MED1822940.1 LacI family DNA-binding transcriptional regulator [Brevibacillus agri]